MSREAQVPSTFLAGVILVVTYGVIISERVDRTAAAVVGAVLVVLLGLLSQERALHHIDFNTLGLLLGMMITINVLRRTGVFAYVGYALAKRVRGDGWLLLLGFSLVTAVASAFLPNVTTVLLMIPATIAITDAIGYDGRPFMMAEVIASNIGGTATLIGDPPNLLIGSATGLDFVNFLTHLAPIALVILALTVAAFWWRYGRGLRPDPDRVDELMQIDEGVYLTDARLLAKCLVVLGLMLVGFLVQGTLRLEVATIALAGAAGLLLLDDGGHIHETLAEVEWPTLFFFAGLFVIVGAVQEAGLIRLAAEGLISVTGGNLVVLALGLLWFSGIISGIVDNIPAVTALIPMVQEVARSTHPQLPADASLWQSPQVLPLWWALALGADLGGNATLVGASANIVAAGIAQRRGEPITFLEFLKVGAPLTAMYLVVCTAYLWLRYLR
jgi:Na+/H+ antiporter NhaD/arsenite permease-like protein